MVAAAGLGATGAFAQTAAPVAPAPAAPKAVPAPPPPIDPVTGLPVVVEDAIREAADASRAFARSAQLQVGAARDMVLHLRNDLMGGSSGDGVPPLVLRFTQRTPEDDAATAEDLLVMTRVLENTLEKTLGEQPRERRAGIEIWRSGSPSARAMYLEGFGAVFMVKVYLPLLGEEPRAEAPRTNAPPPDSEWEKARSQLRGHAEDPEDKPRTTGSEPASNFDAAMVDALQTALLKSLKEAANMRQLKPDDQIAVTLFGSPASRSGKGVSTLKLERDAAGRWSQNKVYSPNALPIFGTSGPGTVLALRASFKDVSAFARGSLDFETFKGRIQWQRYAGAGYDVTSVNSWVKPSSSSSRARTSTEPAKVR
jgi:hypothetical protein